MRKKTAKKVDYYLPNLSYKRILLRLALPRLFLLHLLIQDGNDEIVFGHEVILRDEGGEPTAKTSFILVLVEERPVVVVSVTEDAINASTHGAQFGHGRLLDGDAGGEVFVAVEETGGAVERVTRVIHRRTLLGSLMGGAQEDPLFRGRHLRAALGIALGLELDRQSVQFEAKLAQMLVFPHSFVLMRIRPYGGWGKMGRWV